MSEYLILIYGDETANQATGPEGWAAVHAGHASFGQAHSGAIRGGNALHTSDTATSVRPDGSGGFSVIDGPFVETKEALGGYYLVEAADLDEAIAMAQRIPMPNGGVEVRPIFPIDMEMG